MGVYSGTVKGSLLSGELEMAQDMSLLVCDPRFNSFFLIPYQMYNSTQDRLKLASYIKGTWSTKFLNYAIILGEQIHKLNFT